MIRVELQAMKKESGMTNKEISEKSGVSLVTVNRVMSGQTDIPNFQTVCDLVMAMGGSLDELAGITRPTQKHDTSVDVYLGIIRDKDLTIAEKNRWLKVLFIISCTLVAVLLGLLIFDYTHPAIGFFRR